LARILSDIPLLDTALRQLEAMTGEKVRQLPPHEKAWDLPADAPRDGDILLCKVPPRQLDELTRLKMIQITSVGYDNLRDRGFADRPIRVCNARGLYDTAIAEWVVAMMINLARDLRSMIRYQEQAHWERANRFQEEIRERTIGLWGYGGIGRATAYFAKALGMTVHVMTRAGVKPRPNTYVLPNSGDPEGVLPDRVFIAGQEQEFLAGLDFLVLALPHTRQSDGMIGEGQLRALPRTAFVLNPARGPIVREKALLRALEENWIAGAALDTHFAYPLPPEHPLWRMPNVILTPHISGADKSASFPGRIADLFLQNVERYLHGKPLLNELTVQEWREA
jgi:phosphoglycerate dehydrogenase-like enzyme